MGGGGGRGVDDSEDFFEDILEEVFNDDENIF